MKIKCGFLAIGAGLTTLLAGLAIKEHCTKCGSALFGFGLAHVFLGAVSLMKGEGGIIPKQITIPMSNMEIDMQ